MAQYPPPEPVDRHEVVRVQDDGGPEYYPPPADDGYQRRERVVQDVAAERRLRLLKITELIWLLTGFLEGLIAIRIVLKLIAANPVNSFARFIYDFTGFFLAPFFGLTGNPAAGGVVFEISSIIGMLFYLLVAWAVVRLIWVIFAPSSAYSSTVYDRQRR